MAKKLALAVITAVSFGSAQAGVRVVDLPPPPPAVKLQAVIDVGMTSICGMREAPHLIEHLLLSETPYGEAPVDAILALKAQGIDLSAMTHSDFTEFTLEGPADKADEMVQALVTFLARPSLPITGFENEKRVILSELRAGPDYVSTASLYERLIAKHAGGTAPCAPDPLPFLDYDYESIQRAYKQHYTAGSVSVAAQGQPSLFDLSGLAAAIREGKATTIANSQAGKRENVESLEIRGQAGLVEIIFPLAGRSELPQEAAQAIADQVRLEVQKYIRREHQLYIARTYVSQSLKGGWMRLEIPRLGEEHIPSIVQTSHQAIARIDYAEHDQDVIWKLKGETLSSNPIGHYVVAEPPSRGLSLWDRLMQGFSRLASLFVS